MMIFQEVINNQGLLYLKTGSFQTCNFWLICASFARMLCTNRNPALLSGVPDYFGRNKISSGGDLSHYSSASLY